jgi:hypothetical protein
MTTQFFYTLPDGSAVTYDNPLEMALWLLQHPDELDNWHSSMYRLASQQAAWDNYRGMRDVLNWLVDVLAARAKLNGNTVLE